MKKVILVAKVTAKVVAKAVLAVKKALVNGVLSMMKVLAKRTLRPTTFSEDVVSTKRGVLLYFNHFQLSINP